MNEQADNPLEFFTLDELVEEIKSRSQTLFLAVEPLGKKDIDWFYAWKSGDNKIRTAIALSDEAAFKLRQAHPPLDVTQPPET